MDASYGHQVVDIFPLEPELLVSKGQQNHLCYAYTTKSYLLLLIQLNFYAEISSLMYPNALHDYTMQVKGSH